jgi:hypothetical protein
MEDQANKRTTWVGGTKPGYLEGDETEAYFLFLCYEFQFWCFVSSILLE